MFKFNDYCCQCSECGTQVHTGKGRKVKNTSKTIAQDERSISESDSERVSDERQNGPEEGKRDNTKECCGCDNQRKLSNLTLLSKCANEPAEALKLDLHDRASAGALYVFCGMLVY